MAYRKTYGRKRYGRKRYGRKKKTFASTLYQGASTATKALAMAKTAFSTASKLRGIINSEKKKYDANSGGAVNLDTSGGAVVNCTAIAQGDTITSRNGNSILAKYLSVRGTMYINTLTNAICYVHVVQDNQQVGDTTPSWGDVFTQVYGHPLLNSATAGRFTILATKCVSLQAGQAYSQPLSFDLPLNHHVRYNGTATTDIQKGGIYVFAVSEYAPGAATKPQISAWSRLTYYDN